MNSKKSFLLMAIVTSVLLLLSSCAPKGGIIRGKLVDERGITYASEFAVLLCKVKPDGSGCLLNYDYQTTTVGGEFNFTDPPVGEYNIYVVSITQVGNLLSGGDGKPLVVQVERGKDLDLGTITLNSTTPQ